MDVFDKCFFFLFFLIKKYNAWIIRLLKHEIMVFNMPVNNMTE